MKTLRTYLRLFQNRIRIRYLPWFVLFIAKSLHILLVLPEATFFEGKPAVQTSLRNMIKTHYRGIEREEENPVPGRNWTHDLRHVLCCCTATGARYLQCLNNQRTWRVTLGFSSEVSGVSQLVVGLLAVPPLDVVAVVVQVPLWHPEPVARLQLLVIHLLGNFASSERPKS